jgi:hypothetical protein
MNTREDYIKQVLTKVSCDQDLFMKVLCESIITLEENVLNEMKCWCLSEFGPDYINIIRSCFDVLECQEISQEIQSIYQKNQLKN